MKFEPSFVIGQLLFWILNADINHHAH